MSSITTDALTPFAPQFKVAIDILPCSTFFNFLESEFIEQVFADISNFVTTSQYSEPAVFLFPPVSPRLRYLIHQVVEINFKTLQTFSIGRIERRTVVCSKSIPKVQSPSFNLASPNSTQMASECKQQRKTRVVNERAIYRPPPARCILQEKITEPNVDPAPTIQTPNNANLKRPSLPLYVPRGRTSSTSKEEQTNVKETKSSKEIKVPVEQKAKEKQPKKSSSKKASKSLRVPVEDESNQTPVFKDEPSDIQLNAPPQTVRKISRTCSNPVIQPSVLDLGDLMESSELAEFSNQMHEKQVSVSKAEDTDEEDTWEKLYNDTGDLLRPDALEELTVAVGSVQIIKPAPETYRFVASESHDEELAHVIEVYDFPPTLKTEDIFCALTTIGSPADFSLKWVDDTHALAIYGSPYAAIDALSAPRGMVKLRPLAQATKESRNCARRLSSTLQPFKPRPATSASLAKRLVSTALGIKNTVSPEQRKIERQMLADAKAKKRIIAQQREAMWEGTISTP